MSHILISKVQYFSLKIQWEESVINACIYNRKQYCLQTYTLELYARTCNSIISVIYKYQKHVWQKVLSPRANLVLCNKNIFIHILDVN